MFDLDISTIIARVIVLLIAFTIHELAHAVTADYLGDPTPRRMGRITLNPLKPIDPVGTVLVPFATLWLGGFLFGWAKPVPVNFGNLRHPKRDMLWVAAAGPGSNFVMALAWAMVLGLASGGGPFSSAGLQYMSVVGVVINVSLMVLNLLPILPLDGGRIALSLLPRSLAIPYSNTERFGFILVIVLLVTGALGVAMRPLFGLAVTAIEAITGVDLPGGL